MRSYVSDVLAQSGFEVLEADTAEAALAHIAAGGRICAVISDVAMPGSLDGFELARRLRKDFPRVGVVLVSGVMEPQGYLPSARRALPG